MGSGMGGPGIEPVACRLGGIFGSGMGGPGMEPVACRPGGVFGSGIGGPGIEASCVRATVLGAWLAAKLSAETRRRPSVAQKTEPICRLNIVNHLSFLTTKIERPYCPSYVVELRLV